MSKAIYTYPHNKFHYVYRITNIFLNKHYIGARTSTNRLPKDDIGVKYFSSSKDKDFLKDQKVNHHNYTYTIIKNCETRNEAIQLESDLHKVFHVKVSKKYYNKAIQTSTGFDFDCTGMVPVKDKNGKTFSVPIDDPRLTNGEVVHARTGMVPVKDKNGNTFSVPDDDPRLTNSEVVHVRTGMKHSQKSKDKICESKLGENNPRFTGWYHIPQFGKFASSYSLEDKGLSNKYMIRYCKTHNTKIISKHVYGGSKFLKNHFGPDIIGKTFKDIGFWFETM